MNRFELPQTFSLPVRIGLRDIAQGCRSDGENCPGARATLRAAAHKFPDDTDFHVFTGSHVSELLFVWERDEDGEPEHFTQYTAENPPRLSFFISNFDGYEPVEPVAFTLRFERTYEDGE